MKVLLVFLVVIFSYSNIFALSDVDLKEKVDKIKWLSIPHSRISVNPVGIGLTGEMMPHFSDGSFGSISLNAGYFYGEVPLRIPNIWSWKPVDKSIKSNSNIATGYFDIINLNWYDNDVKSHRVRDAIQLVQTGYVVETGSGFGYIQSEAFPIDVDETPILYINVEDNNEMQGWGLKVGLEGMGDEPIIINGTCEKGNFAFDLRQYVKWSGKQRMYVRVFTVGKKDGTLLLKNIGFGSIDNRATGFEINEEYWQPSQLNYISKSPTRNIDVNAVTFFADEDIVSQKLTVTKSEGNDLIMSGIWGRGSVDIKEEDKIIIFTHSEYAIILALSGNPEFHKYQTLNDYVIGNEDKTSKDGFWVAKYDSVREGEIIYSSALFVPGGNVNLHHIEKAKSAIEANNINKSLSSREFEWDKNLAKVPIPENFNLISIDYKGTTPEILEKIYYKAWAFLYTTILPPMEENDFHYPQFAAGKPSLWSEGHEKAGASAQWESIIAMQFGAYVEPEIAWDSLEGLMTLVDSEGTMGGEALPSRHVQSALILYNLTGNKERLNKIYPEMKRFLEWKIRDPRWMYLNLTDETCKDCEFVVQALTDIKYMIEVCQILNMNEEIKYWENQINPLYENYIKWFWKERGKESYRLFWQNEFLAPDHNWSLVGLGLIKDDILQNPERDSLLKLYKDSLSENYSFFLDDFNKHPSRQLLMRGLLWLDMYDDAKAFAEVGIRDVARAGNFSEGYTNTPETKGVTPSIFGMANTIDAALWLNGVWISEGLPIIIDLREGGVKNLLIRGKYLNISVKEDGFAELSGNAIDLFNTPSGFALENGAFRGKIDKYRKVELSFK